MKPITLNNSSYTLVTNFKHNPALRASFNALTQATFGFHFEDWYANGYWKDQYIPYSLLHNGTIIANVSISKMELTIDDEQKTAIQIGTVMTDKNYRNKGLSRFLMEEVMAEWKGKTDFIYLFANDSVLDFYPKFDFVKVAEYEYSRPLQAGTGTHSALRQLNIDDTRDRELLLSILKDDKPISSISMQNNSSLLMFYFSSFKKNSLYYLEELNTVVVLDDEGDSLFLSDVFSTQNIALTDLIQYLPTHLQTLRLGFSPKQPAAFQPNLITTEDTLFVTKESANYFRDNKWRFPVLSHA